MTLRMGLAGCKHLKKVGDVRFREGYGQRRALFFYQDTVAIEARLLETAFVGVRSMGCFNKNHEICLICRLIWSLTTPHCIVPLIVKPCRHPRACVRGFNIPVIAPPIDLRAGAKVWILTADNKHSIFLFSDSEKYKLYLLFQSNLKSSIIKTLSKMVFPPPPVNTIDWSNVGFKVREGISLMPLPQSTHLTSRSQWTH